MKLAASDLVLLAAQAGFTDLSTAAAVALAESGGNPQAFNPEGSYGLWQIYLPDHPEFAGVDLTDPATNAAAAFRVYANAGYKFTPWSAFKNGAYTRYMSSAQAAVSQLNAAAAQAVQIAPGVTLLPPVVDPGANPSDVSIATAGGQIQQVPGWVWIAAGALGLMVWMQD